MEVPVFFYGGLINPAVQKRVGLEPGPTRRATLRDFRITFEPWVNLRRSEASMVRGLVIDISHSSLDRVYSNLGARYLPVPVLCETDAGASEPALCFIAESMSPGPVDRPHVQALLDAIELLEFPRDYIDEVSAFLPPS